MNRFNGAVAVAALLALSACSKGEDRKDAGAGKAQGEILPGSTSDAMIPLDQVKSQAPLAPKSEGGDKTAPADKGKEKDKAKPKPDAPSAPDAADEPATEQ